MTISSILYLHRNPLTHGFEAERRGRLRRLGSDEHGQVIDVLLRDKRDRASAEAFFRQALERTDVTPKTVISDHHQPYVKATATVLPFVRHVRTGLHHRRGYTTQSVERSHGVKPRYVSE